MMVSLKNPHVAAVIVFNVIFIVLGAAVVCGAIALAKKVFQNYVKMRLQNLSINTDSVDFSELDSFVNTLMALGLATGGILFLMGTIGVVGASYCNNICLNLCAAFLIASALMCTVPPIGMYTNYVDDQIYRQVLEKMGNSYTGHNNKHMWSAIMNAFMMSMRCCGWHSYKNFGAAEHWNRTVRIGKNNKKMVLPRACCKLDGPLPDGKPIDVDACLLEPDDANSYWKTGCKTALTAELQKMRLPTALTCATLIAMQLTTIWLITAVQQEIQTEKDRCEMEERNRLLKQVELRARRQKRKKRKTNGK